MSEMIVCDTPEMIEAFKLLSLKGALKLESIGLKRRGPSALSEVKKITGIKARSAADMLPKYIAWLEEKGFLQSEVK